MATLKEIFANALARTPKQTEDINIVPLQVDENGQYDPAASAALDLRIKQATMPMTPKERFLTGRELTQDYQTINPETGKAEMATVTNKKNGLLPDLVSGFQENYTQGFDVNNLVPQNKGLATKIGEGLGTLARFYDKPIGRMAVATGLSMLTDEANPLGEGVKAYVGRQKNMTQDSVYRNQLKQLGMTDDEVNAIPGNVTKDVFEGVTSGMRLGNQRMTYGQLAMLDDGIAEEVRKNPELANMFVPINIARDIYTKKRPMTESKMEETKAKTEKTKAETKQVGKPKVNINIKQGGTTSRIIHEGGSPKPTKPERPTRTTGAGRARVSNQQYTQEEIRKELKRRGLI